MRCERTRRKPRAYARKRFNRLKRNVGELTMDLDIMHEAARLRPTTQGTSAE